GFRRMLEVWPAILVAGVTFSAVQYLIGAYLGASLADISAAVLTIAVLVVFLRFWKPRHVLNAKREEVADVGRERVKQNPGNGSAAVFHAWMPWIILCVVVFAWGIPEFSSLMNKATTMQVPVAGLHKLVERVPPVANTPEP